MSDAIGIPLLIVGSFLLGVVVGTPIPPEPAPECPAGMVKVESLKINGVVWVRCEEDK